MRFYTILIGLLIFTIFSTNNLTAQKKFYVTTGGEMIFSFAPDIDNNGTPGNSIVRWTPWFNIQSFGHYNFSKVVGILFGAAIRNVGYIDDNVDPDNSAIKKKYRSYNFGIPVGLKIGLLNKFFLFGGYEIEFPFHYKEKTFENNSKIDNKITGWFTGRTNCCMNTVFAGIHIPFGINIKFKYYLTNFHNEDFTQVVNGETVKPYAGKKVNIMYVSVSFALFRNAHLDKQDYKRSKNKNDNIY